MDYKQRVLEEFKRLKQPKDLHSANGNIITLPFNDGFLVPISEFYVDDDALIETLGQWAEEKNYTFPVQFKVTRESTKRWLKQNILADPGRILFLVTNTMNIPIGHLGFIDCINDDQNMWMANLLRGEDDIDSGVMGRAVNSMLIWAYKTIRPERINCRVLAGNEKAIVFLMQNDFVEYKHKVYRPESVGDVVELSNWSSDNIKGSEVEFIFMYHNREGDKFQVVHQRKTES